MNLTVRSFLFGPLVCGGLFLASCASPDLNPASPRPNTGYVDFYTDSSLGLSWQVKQFDEATGEARTVFSKFDPVPGTVLRLPSAPGKQRFQVWFTNRATKGPQEVAVQVDDGKVTPVRVVLTPVGTTLVDQEHYAVRGSAKGAGRRSKFTTDVNQLYDIDATAQPAQAYRPKERMAYWSTAGE
jgi:hypothetical protein